MVTPDAWSSSQTCISFRPTTCLLLATSETLEARNQLVLGIGRLAPIRSADSTSVAVEVSTGSRGLAGGFSTDDWLLLVQPSDNTNPT
jgi:hypothetical protein